METEEILFVDLCVSSQKKDRDCVYTAGIQSIHKDMYGFVCYLQCI